MRIQTLVLMLVLVAQKVGVARREMSEVLNQTSVLLQCLPDIVMTSQCYKLVKLYAMNIFQNLLRGHICFRSKFCVFKNLTRTVINARFSPLPFSPPPKTTIMEWNSAAVAEKDRK